MRGLKVLLWICGIFCLLGLALMFMPWSAVNSLCEWAGFEPLLDHPFVVYGYRVSCAFMGLIGVFFIILARDPLRYPSMLSLGIFGLLFIGVVCLASGLLAKIQPPFYLSDGGFCVLFGILLLIFRSKALTTN